ncbi:MAG: hypothetical protein IH840_17335 [Candidatus Heimdallarchaeota archaeon]|nr:hypothetical protein [Candidatus Heimdallarchaeota archaeon]
MIEDELLEFIPVQARLYLFLRDNFIQVFSFLFMMVTLVIAWPILTFEAILGILFILVVYGIYVGAVGIEKRAFAKKMKEDKARYKKRY